jgi:flagellar M-ring protein FliF
MLLLAGGGVTVGLLSLFVYMIGSPDYKPLFTGLETADAQTLTAQLDAEGIPHQTSADGKTISVPSSKLDAARLKTATAGAPHSGRMGFELFDKMSWGQTEFDQRVAYQRALEGELERTIETIGDVQRARVHLVMPTDSVFLDRKRAAKASVILKLRGKGLPKEAVLAVSRLVAGAVDELQPEDVSIVDADSARSLGLHHNQDGGRDDGEGVETTMTQRLLSTLEPVVGVDKIKASVNIDRNMGTTEESDEKYDPAVSALLSYQRSEESDGAAAPASGVPGTTSNTPKLSKPGTPATPSNGSQSSRSETAQYGVNKVVVHTMAPAGEIQRVSAAILVDDAMVKSVQGGKTTYTRRSRTPQELNQIRELAEAVIGFDAKRGDTISVENMAFDSTAADMDIATPNLMEKSLKTVSENSSILKPVLLLVGFVLAYLFVIRPIQKQALKPGLPAPAPQAAFGAVAGNDLLTEGSADVDGQTIRATKLKERAVELIKQKPANTARALQAWLREEPS